MKFIEAHKDAPFYAYLPFLAVHVPIGALMPTANPKFDPSAMPDASTPNRKKD